MDLQTLEIFTALLLGPVLAGCLIGALLRRVKGARTGGLLSLAGLLLTPALAGGCLELLHPVMGVWDGVLEGLLAGAGLAATAHVAFARPRQVLLALASFSAGLLILELAARVAGTPPAFAAGAPHLLIEDAVRSSNGPGDATDRQIVCSMLYGDRYEGVFNVLADTVEQPSTFAPREARHVLHIGDSMVYGAGVPRSENFVAELGRLEPGVQHINAGIPGTGPDAYLVMLRSWVARQKIDLAIWYLFEMNDFNDIDTPYPCCDWKSLFVYQADGPHLRLPERSHSELRHAGLRWIVLNSPPPYLLRALVHRSAAAARTAAVIASWAGLSGMVVESLTHEQEAVRLAALLRTARDEMEAKHIPFAVVLLPWRRSVEQGRPGHGLSEMRAMAEALGIPTFDATEVIQAGGTPLFLGDNDCHFNAAGHQVMARWLHEKLARLE